LLIHHLKLSPIKTAKGFCQQAENDKNIPRRAVKATGRCSPDELGSPRKKEEGVRPETPAPIIPVVVMIFVPRPLWKKFAPVAARLPAPPTGRLNSTVGDVRDPDGDDF
jgi:hypothetical protein